VKTLWMTKGLPASGKTSWARAFVDSLPKGSVKRVSKDDLRAMLDNGKHCDSDRFVLQIRDAIVIQALSEGKHVVVEDTNLAPKHETWLRELAKQHGAEFKVKDFTDVNVETCIANDHGRPNYVGERVIRDMYDRYLRPAVPQAPDVDPSLPFCVIVDIDGTIAQMNGRGPFELDRVGSDTFRGGVWAAIKGMLEYGDTFRATAIALMFVSGREDTCRCDTLQWLGKHGIIGHELFMRVTGDKRKDSIVKRELFDRHIRGKYNVRAIFDDRPSVIRMWRGLGFSDRIFDVGTGREF
jgi:predicted kinase